MEQQAISSDLIRGHIDTIILHSLIDGDKFAQQISDSIEEKSNGEYKMIQATLYSSLKRLEGLKYVSSYWYDNNENTGRRKFFKITDLGKETVKNNLNNWSYSRALIDKLVDCEPEPIYKTQYVEKIVEVQVPIAQTSTPLDIKEKSFEQTQNLQLSIDNLQKEAVKEEKISEQTRQEVNFRNILNGLIKSNQPKKQEVTELEPIVKEEINENSCEKLKFNETITAVDYNAQKSQNNGKIDFGDLVLEASKDGYKIRISSKDSSASNGKLLINKLNFFSSLFLYVLFLIEFLVVGLTCSSILMLDTLKIALVIIVATIFPAIYSSIYINAPKRKTNKLIYSDTILTASIIVFNLLLITFAGNLIFSVNFNDLFNLLSFLVLPAIIYFDILVFYIIKFFFAKTKFFAVKKLK